MNSPSTTHTDRETQSQCVLPQAPQDKISRRSIHNIQSLTDLSS